MMLQLHHCVPSVCVNVNTHSDWVAPDILDDNHESEPTRCWCEVAHTITSARRTLSVYSNDLRHYIGHIVVDSWNLMSFLYGQCH